jgi:hypothetical protein
VPAPSTSHASKEQLRIEAQSCRIKIRRSPNPPWVTQRRAVLAEIEITELHFPAISLRLFASTATFARQRFEDDLL